MDSLTQITLGAAVGEVVLGKKVGNRALLWGAIGGTIPDLDVFANFLMSEIDALAFHRGFTHSITFAILGGLGFGWVLDKFYKSEYYKYIAFTGWFLFILGVLVLFNIIVKKEFIHIWAFAGSFIVFVYLISRLVASYLKSDRELPVANRSEWQWLFFWAILTHTLLDCFTVFGTQLFQPFSAYRVSFDTISVADPLYTAPFLLCVILVSFFDRNSRKRRIINYIGIGISSAYLLFTVFNKARINKVFKNSFAAQNIDYQRFVTTPTILNNVLWYGIADGGDVYYTGLYSLFDKEPKVQFEEVHKNEGLLNAKEDDRTVNILKWFSNGYFNVIERKDGLLQVNDMRYGSTKTNERDEDDYIFNFPLAKNSDGYYELKEARGGPPEGDERKMLKSLIERMKGI